MADTDTDRRRDAYLRLKARPEGPLVEGAPAIFSPAIGAQDEQNPRSTIKRFGPQYLAAEYTDWIEEAAAHVTSCYLGDWSGLAKVLVTGPEALAFLSRLGMNDLSRFEVGRVKHHVQLDELGRIASEGVLLRRGEQEFQYTAGSGDWLLWQLEQGSWDAAAHDVSPDRFIFGVQGPTSIHVLERALEAGLRDLGFNHARSAVLAGGEVEVLRTGISGELGYEVHGPAERANEVWRLLREAGQDFGLRQLGVRSQSVQHIESGIATNGLDYFPSAAMTPGAPWQFKRGGVAGSFVPSAFTDYFRTPAELGWSARAGTHDFIGRDALLAEDAAGGSARVLAGLVWDRADVAAILASALDDGPLPDQMELPKIAGPAFDSVRADGREVGVATGRTLSPALRQTISLVTIERAFAVPGTRVTVLWGRPGTAQREIGASLVALPFKPDRRRVDVSTL